MTPSPFQPGCNMSFAQWQKSEDTRIKALTICKAKSALFQYHPCSAFGSSYAAKMKFAVIDHKVHHQVELAKMEQEVNH
jgi:hypothetical protein